VNDEEIRDTLIELAVCAAGEAFRRARDVLAEAADAG
jgi:alkylhydroperoxidase/carboxymuconolactone decarboxylase family protein YurZ